MKKLFWFTQTGITSKKHAQLDFSLNDILPVFKNKEIWKKKRYRTEYNHPYEEKDFEKIKSVTIHLHSDAAPLSQFHEYEKILSQYIAIDQIERTKLFASGIAEVGRLAVIEIDFVSEHPVMPVLNYDQEKNIDAVMGQLQHYDAWEELRRLKSIVSELVQFFMFNFHLNFLTEDYTFSITDKPELSGITVVRDDDKLYYETDRIELLSHYILYEKEKDNMQNLMNATAMFWCNEIPTIHFFLEALKGNHLTYSHFTKLVFTIESFFADRISNDYMTLVIPLLIVNDINDMQQVRQLMKKCFSIRNDIVHGGSIPAFRDVKDKKNGIEKRLDDYFYELKNVITRLLYWYINNRGFEVDNYRLTHERIFELLPNGISKPAKKKLTWEM